MDEGFKEGLREYVRPFTGPHDPKENVAELRKAKLRQSKLTAMLDQADQRARNKAKAKRRKKR